MPYQPFKNMHVFKINLPLGKGNMKMKNENQPEKENTFGAGDSLSEKTFTRLCDK